jgi:23S rRNA (uracil1939-C5)-methyltransferase
MQETLQPAAVPAEPATPPCPHFGPCGGCQLQNLAYPSQLALKADRMRGLFAAAGLELPELELHPSPPLGYRNRIRLTLAEVDGELRAGYIGSSVDDDQGGDQPNQRQRGATFLPITQCPIAAPILWRAAKLLLALMNADRIAWARNPQFVPDQLELFTTADESRLQLSLFLRSSARSLPNTVGPLFTLLCEALRAHVPELAGAGISVLPPLSAQRSRRTEQPRPGPVWGSPGLNYPVAQPATGNSHPATAYWVPRGAFFQVNRFLLPELLRLVTASRSGSLAWDLYAGVGLFSRALAARFAEVTAVEIAEPAVSALASSKLGNLHVVKATTLSFLRTAVLHRERPELIVLDPPRTGAGPEVCELLANIAAPTLVYVSCSPETLPADLATLAASGYRVSELHLPDLFPQTTHIESVAVLSQGESSRI